MTDTESAPADSLEVRSRLIQALKLDLVGPWADHELGAEQLPGRERPSNWYVAGFLIPTGSPSDRSGDVDEDDDLGTVPESADLTEESNDERKVARKAYFPSSIGLSFLVAETCLQLAVTVRWGDYESADIEEEDGSKTSVWQRTPREAALSIPLGGDAGSAVRDLPGSDGLQLHVAERSVDAAGLTGAHLPAGTRSVSCFLVNRRTPDEAQPDRAYAFQAEIEIRTDEGFAPPPYLRAAPPPSGTIPLQEEGGIEAFLRREVLPYAADPRYQADSVKTGYEISFTRHFYKPKPMRTLAEIRADILALEKDTEGLLAQILGAGAGR